VLLAQTVALVVPLVLLAQTVALVVPLVLLAQMVALVLPRPPQEGLPRLVPDHHSSALQATGPLLFDCSTSNYCN
jgi:hypothetical protein